MKMILNILTQKTPNFKIAILLVCSILIGCHTVKIDTTTMLKGSKNPVALGVIGLQKNRILHSEFQSAAIPEYKKNIRVRIKAHDFTQKAFNSYSSAAKDNPLGIKYVDSLKNKPQFITVDVLDRIAILSELEETYNSHALAYLKTQKKAVIVTSLSLGLQKQYLEEIKAADAVFLSNTPYKQYQLSLVRKGKTYTTIDFSKATIFAYEVSSFCWGENNRKQITLANIIDKNSTCPKNTYRKAEKAIEKLNYFKL